MELLKEIKRRAAKLHMTEISSRVFDLHKELLSNDIMSMSQAARAQTMLNSLDRQQSKYVLEFRTLFSTNQILPHL